MRRISGRILAVAFLGAALWPLSSEAQDKKREKECDKAAKVIEKGHPAHKQADALNTLLGCGATGANATSAAIQASRTEQDTVVLRIFYDLVDGWRDAVVMQAALQVARDESAEAPARVFAIRHLLVLLRPSAQFAYGRLARSVSIPDDTSSARSVTSCASGYASERGELHATPLPVDFAAQVTQALEQIKGAPSVPTTVRNAAGCTRF